VGRALKVLFTGTGTSGSWQIRGMQMAAALGARAIPRATAAQCREADVIVAVKRVPADLLESMRSSGRPWLWDCVDAYPQPACGAWNKDEALQWLRQRVAELQPTEIIWPNRRMQQDAGMPGLVLYHHHRPAIRINPIRERIEAVGYEGSPAYIAGWRAEIEAECARIGARFVVNPVQLSDVDVVLALRDTQHAGYPQRHWKSQVKLANAHGSGTPFVGMPEDGYQETRTGAEYWASSPSDLRAAFGWLASQSAREEVHERFLQAAFPVKAAAQQLRDYLCASKF
jgi:hypothetical protein